MSVPAIDYRSRAVLFVDDEPKSRKFFRRLYGEQFRILEAEDGNRAYEVFLAGEDEIGVIVTDQRMPNGTGTSFLARIGGMRPEVVRILSTAYSDLDAAIDAVNRGGIYRYVTKPWDVSELELTLRRAMELHHLRREQAGAHAEKIRMSRLAAFALAPVAARLEFRRVAEAVAALVRLGARGGVPAMEGGNLAALHASQLAIASRLEARLRAGLGERGLAARSGVLAGSLGAELEDGGSRIRLVPSGDLFPAWLQGLMGSGPVDPVPGLAAMIGVYDAGGSVTRDGGDPSVLHLVAAESDAGLEPGFEVIRWIFDREFPEQGGPPLEGGDP